MGNSEATPVDIFLTYDWDSNKYFQDCFEYTGKASVCMHHTVKNMMGKGFVALDLNYENDYMKR